MRNLLSTPATDVILVAAGGRRQLLESPRVPLPEVARLGQTNTPTGTAQRAVPTVRLTEIGSTRTAEWNITLADQIAGDQDEIGDGMVLIDRDLLGLVWPEPEKIRLRTRKMSTVARKSVILDRTSTTTCRGCISEHRRQEPVWTSVRGAGVKAVSPAERGRSEATRLDVGEHTRTLLA